MQGLFTLCAVAYLLIYAFEGLIRYGLYNIGADSAILLRDGLIIVPLLLMLAVQACRTRVHPAFLAFGAIVALHGLIGTLNFHTVFPAAYGAMLLVNVLFGFIAARALVLPSRKVVLLLGLVWVISVVGIVLDKFFVTFPWTGLETHIGGISVDVSRDWEISDGIAKRAAGFMRSSISAAMLLPVVALIIARRVRNYPLRMLVLFATLGALALTTQKGAVLAFAVITLILATPEFMHYRLLCLAAAGFALLDIALPVFTSGLLVSENGDVFSLASLNMRIAGTWPDAWQWINSNNLFPFGVGLGGIGGAQRFYAQNFFNPSDNLFIFLYANFGVFALFYLGWMVWQGWRQPPETRAIAVTPLAMLAFNLGYGAALSMLEDQVSQLFFGASVGMLWMLRQTAGAKPWANPFRGAPIRFGMPLIHAPKRPVHAVELP
jgi:hypothetical protein